MRTVVITGATRGIGAALARSLAAPEVRLVLAGRDLDAGERVAADARREGSEARVVAADLSSVAGARSLAEALRGESLDALVHNAGVWPSRRELDAQGLERAFVVNHLAPAALTEALLRGPTPPGRVVVVTAGLIALARWSPERTPSGDDFHALRTYANTKLWFALYARSIAARVPVLAVHPGVIRTGLGDRGGIVGALLRAVKRRWKTPEHAARTLAPHCLRDLAAGETDRFFHEQLSAPWPAPADDAVARAEVGPRTEALLARGS
ncbi:MAG: SDR family NAD(P)-dependent oxidoreductase [Polyangiales bacterium]